jgi:aryl-alcohol dehydrogenase-like predicted oxidoreductase
MNYRTLGRTGLRVSEIGFGTWGIGKSAWMGADDQVSIRALETARDLGINFFDTALLYGDGHSERLLARALGKSSDAIIASKVPIKASLQPSRRFAEVFPRGYTLDCLNKTLANLGRETVDIYQFHGWSENWSNDPEFHRTVDDIRKSGKARFVGISVHHHQPNSVLPALETGLIDVVQVIYNIFDQSPADRLLPYCRDHQIGVIARVPFDEGGLTGSVTPTTKFPPGDFRNWYFAGSRKQQVWERVQRIAVEAAIPPNELPDLALRFCLSNPAVGTVIPGMRTVDHVHSNAAIAERGSLPDSLLMRLRKHGWERDFYSTSLTDKLRVFFSAPLSTQLDSLKRRIKRL